jgi:hypothetical protein
MENRPTNPGIPEQEDTTKREQIVHEEAQENEEANRQEELEVSEEIQEKAGSEYPTSSDVGKQTLTQADLGYDVTVEGVPPDDVALKTPQHPDDPSAHEETQRNPGMAGSKSQADE